MVYRAALNGIPLNGIPLNGIPLNGIPLNGIPLNGIPFNGIWTVDAKQTVADTNGFFASCTCAVTFTRHPEGFEVRFLKHTVGVDPHIEL